MKIGYWLGNVTLHSGGVAPYAWRMLELLLTQVNANNVEIIILCSDETQENLLELINKYQAKAKIVIIKGYDFTYLERTSRILGVVLNKIFNKLNISTRSALYLDPTYRRLSSLDIDLLHIPYQTPPNYNLPYPFIVTMHDVQELHFPEFFTPEERANRAANYWKSLKYASGVVVSFDHVKQDLIKYFCLSESKVFVCPLPYNQIKLASPNEQEAYLYTKKYSNLKEFILYPAQTWEHKNHLSLIKAVELIRDKYQHSINVVCTGKKNKFFENP